MAKFKHDPEKISQIKVVGNGVWQIEKGGTKLFRVWWLDDVKGAVWHKMGDFETWDEAVKRTEKEG